MCVHLTSALCLFILLLGIQDVLISQFILLLSKLYLKKSSLEYYVPCVFEHTLCALDRAVHVIGPAQQGLLVSVEERHKCR